MIHHGKIDQGTFSPDAPKQYNSALSKLEGKRVEVKVEEYKKHRSNPQNSYYWGVVIPMVSKELGYTKEEVHSALKNKFLTVTNYSKQDIEFEFTKDTKDLDTTEFEIYLRDVRNFAGDFLGIFIPQPNEKDLY